jgi:protein disulfide-isomerase
MAAENVFSRVGFSKKNLQTPEMQNQNNEILQAFGVFPTIHLAKAVQNDGQINFQGLGSTGYVPGGPNAF